MEPDRPRLYSEVVRRTSTRWLTVRPQGIIVAGQPTREVVVTIQSHAPRARCTGIIAPSAARWTASRPSVESPVRWAR